MELPIRPACDRYAPAGQYGRLQTEVRRRATRHDIPILLVYAFDRRTRLGPFVFVDRSLIPGAPRAIASALYAAGLMNVRVVMQSWSPRVRPSLSRIDGRRPEVLLISSMQIHSGPAYRLIQDAWQLGDDRPLIIAGGPKAAFEPWDFFALSADGRQGADVVVTGEEYVLLELFDRILDHKLPEETTREAFERVRSAGLLADIPGLVYRPSDEPCPPEFLYNTGVQRLVRDLDELPLPFDALGLFEPPHPRTTLSAAPIPAHRLGRHARIMSLVATHGCRFHCPYCPIPAYNQFTYRSRSAARLVEEIRGIAERSGIKHFFGTDDNFFNNRSTTEEFFSEMALGTVHGRPFSKAVTFATEATEADVYKNQDLLPLARAGGLRSLWFGIEDLTAELVKKGQTPEKTQTVFRLLLRHGIAPMPMMMHFDGQPLWSWRGLSGLLNQVAYLWKAGALTCQVTLLTPSVGSASYEQAFLDGIVLGKVAGRPVENYQFDGTHCVATRDPYPWRRQLNVLAGYAAFYNPINFLRALPRFDRLWTERVALQLYGMVGVAKSAWNLRGWFRRLISGSVERLNEIPRPKFPMIAPQGVDQMLARWCPDEELVATNGV